MSIAVRVAPNRFKSLLDLSLSRKSVSSGRTETDGGSERDTGAAGDSAQYLTEHMPSMRHRSFVAIDSSHQRQHSSDAPHCVRSKSMRMHSAALSPLSGQAPGHGTCEGMGANPGSGPVAPPGAAHARFASAVLLRNGPSTARMTVDGLMRTGPGGQEAGNNLATPEVLLQGSRGGVNQQTADCSDGWLSLDLQVLDQPTAGQATRATPPSSAIHGNSSRLAARSAKQHRTLTWDQVSGVDSHGASRATSARQPSCEAGMSRLSAQQVTEVDERLQEQAEGHGAAGHQGSSQGWCWHDITFTQTVDETGRYVFARRCDHKRQMYSLWLGYG